MIKIYCDICEKKIDMDIDDTICVKLGDEYFCEECWKGFDNEEDEKDADKKEDGV